MNYIAYLTKINQTITKLENNLRINEEEQTKINELLNRVLSNNFNLDTFLNICIFLYNNQIFYDGNARTILVFMRNILKEKEYLLDLENILLDYEYLRCYFPTILDFENNPVTENELNKMKNYISKRGAK